MSQVFQGWIANLSNGETVLEQQPLPGEPTSWQKLLNRLSKEHLYITQLRLQRGAMSIVCASNKDSRVNGYVAAYEQRGTLFGTKRPALLQGVGSIVGDLVFMTWALIRSDESTFGIVAVSHEVRDLSDMRKHSTLRDENA